MSHSVNETQTKELSDTLFKTDNIEDATRFLATLQANFMEVQRKAASAAKRQARYMLWAVIVAAISVVITAVGVVFLIFNAPQPYTIVNSPDAGGLVLQYKQPSSGVVDLDGKEINVDAVKDEEGKTWGIRFNFIIKNIGDEQVAAPVFKLYSNHPSMLHHNPSADEPQYLYEEVIGSQGIIQKCIPGKFAVTVPVTFGSFDNSQFSLHNEPLLMKLYYGTGKIAKATVLLSKNSKTP